MSKLDPLKQGIEIFNKIYRQIGKEVITDIKEFESFIQLLLRETDGWVIVDFLDAGNWDSIESYNIDHDRGLIYLNWHEYRNRNESEEAKMMRSMFFPGDVYGLCFQFQELRVINIRDFTFFTFRGYAISTKEVEKIMSEGAEQFKIIDDNDNFSVETVRKMNNEWHSYNFLNTPIFSTLIIPKNIGLRAHQSKGLLFAYNLMQCEERIGNVESEIKTRTLDSDSICEKANTLRRVMESILKIECCYRSRQITVKKSYSDLLLGDLIKLVKEFRNEGEKIRMIIIVRLANELSHDSGKPITKEKVLQLSDLVKKYCETLLLETHTVPEPHYKDW